MKYIAYDDATGYVHVAHTMQSLYKLIAHNYRYDMSTKQTFLITVHGKAWGRIRVDSLNRTIAVDTADGREWYEWDANRYYREVYGV